MRELYRGGSREKVSATVCSGIIRQPVDTVGNCFTETVDINFLLGIKLLWLSHTPACVSLYVGWFSAKYEISRTVCVCVCVCVCVFVCMFVSVLGCDSSVSIATRYVLEGPGI